jgi:hypothetical protein
MGRETGGQRPALLLQFKGKPARCALAMPIHRPATRFFPYHQMFQGPQYGPKSSYIDASSLICAASI